MESTKDLIIENLNNQIKTQKKLNSINDNIIRIQKDTIKKLGKINDIDNRTIERLKKENEELINKKHK